MNLNAGRGHASPASPMAMLRALLGAALLLPARTLPTCDNVTVDQVLGYHCQILFLSNNAASIEEVSGGLFGARREAAERHGGAKDRMDEDTENSYGGGGDDDDDDDDNSAEEDGTEGLPFAAIAMSPDGQWLVVAGADNNILAYSMDRMALHWTLPRPPARLTSMAFYQEVDEQTGRTGGSGGGTKGTRDAGGVDYGEADYALNNDGLLAITCVDNRFVLYEVEARRIADW